MKLTYLSILFLILFQKTVRSQTRNVENKYPIMVKQHGKYGFKNASGKLIIPAQFDATFPFSEDVTPVKKKGKWYYIDTLGKAKYINENGQPNYYKMARPFHDHLAVVSYFWSGKQVTIIDIGGGAAFVDFQADAITDFNDGHAIIKHGNKYGVINTCGDYAIDASYSHIDSFSKGYVKVWDQGQWRIINPFGECMQHCKDFSNSSISEDPNNQVIHLSNYGLQFSEASKIKLNRLAINMLANPTKKWVIEGHGFSSYAAQQNSWECTNKVIHYLIDQKKVNPEQFIFTYGLEGVYRTVNYREAQSGEEGPSNTAPPFGNMRCNEY